MVKIVDVAKRAGVSKSSVSRVLNKRYEYMSEDMRNKINKAIAELDYKPNNLAQSLKTKKSKVIGMVFSDLMNPLWSEVINGAQEECFNRGYSMMLSTSREDSEYEKNNIQLFLSKYVDGIIINSSGGNADLYAELANKKYPLIFLDRSPKFIATKTVKVNNNTGVKKALEYLYELGHKNIAIVLYELEDKSPRVERLESYIRTFELLNMEVNKQCIKICKQFKGSGTIAVDELMDLDNPPTAIISTHTFLNLEIIESIRNKNLKIPEDISVVGYDDFSWTPFLDPSLTTIAQPAYELGIRAVSNLIDQIEGKSIEISDDIIEPELIIRKSCSKPKNYRL